MANCHILENNLQPIKLNKIKLPKILQRLEWQIATPSCTVCSVQRTH